MKFRFFIKTFFFVQIIRGILLATSYLYRLKGFYVSYLRLDVVIRLIHTNGARFVFLFIYIHISRGLYYSSFKKSSTWSVGVTILFLIMATAFLGYVLPVNQMSFWGASVITRLVREIPYFGVRLINFLWGDWTVRTPLYTRFFRFHYIIPFIIIGLIFIHVFFLHSKGSSDPLGLNYSNKRTFKNYFSVSDYVVISLFMIFSFCLVLLRGDIWDPDVFAVSEALVTPQHIQPEWYFLFAYAILRAVPSKLGGVIALVFSIGILYILPYLNIRKRKRINFYWLNKYLFWLFVLVVITLTWVGFRPAEPPYIRVSRVLIGYYFLFFFMSQVFNWGWDFLLFK